MDKQTPRERILFLLEGDAEFAQQFAEQLGRHGYQVRVFTEFKELAAALKSVTPIALVMDWVPPSGEMGSTEFAHQLHEQAGQIVPIIFLSVRDDFASRLAAVGAGATHYLTKPLDLPRLIQIFEDYFGSNQANPYRVLVVDDDASLADMYRMYLEQAGLSVAVVYDPLAAMAELEQFEPDLVLMDINMPQCDGLELASVIRQFEEYDQLPIVFLTTEGGSADKKLAATHLGSEEFLSKPVLPWHLVSVIMSRIKRARALRRAAVHTRRSLRELEQFKFALDQHAIVSIADSSGQITYVNDKFCEVSGYSRNELLGKNHRILKSGAHPPELYAQMWVTIASGQVWQGEIQNRKKNGEFYWVETTIVPFVDDCGVPLRYISIRTEIIPIKVIEQTLQISDARLRRSQAYANIGTWDWDIQTGALYWSERIGPLFGYAEDKLETTYENFLNAVHPDDRQKVVDAVNATVEHDANYDIEHRCVWPDGTVRWMLERGAVVRDKDGKPLNMLGVVQDVTERKLAEQALQLSEQRLRDAQHIARLGHWTWDVASGEITWSDEIYRIFGREPGEFKPTYAHFMAVVHPDDVESMKRSEQEAFAKGAKHSIDHRIILPGGEICWVHEEAVAVCDAQGRPISLTGTVQDVTERKHEEAELVRARDEAERANRAKSDFLASMSHELRTPLNAILGFGQLLMSDSVEVLTPSQQENVEHIVKGGWHLLELINEVLDLAKIESGKIGLSIENVDPGEVLKECIDLIAGVAMQRGIKVLSQDVATGSCLVRADRFRLKQAILNLLSNAVKYNRDNGFVSISMERAGDGRLGLCIEDTGRGLTEQQLQQLFEPFNRLGAEQTAVQGTGIGLAITKRIVELMDGSITAVSAPGQGSTFRIELVTSAVGQSTAAAEASRRMADYGEETPRTILYVEDNPANLRLMAQLLARRPNITLLSAHTGNWGLEFALAQRPDLIILDINLPGMGGFEVLAQLRLHPETRHIPVIAVSADAMPWDIERGLTAGFAYYLSKPLDIEELRQILNEILPPECSLEKTNIKERVQNG